MRQYLDKDLGWTIVFASFIGFLVSSVVFSMLSNQPDRYPAAILMANAHLGRSFLLVLFRVLKYLSLGCMVYGIVGVITWPPGPGNL